MDDPKKTTHFGYEEVPWEGKENRVKGVFDSVADRYDLMNDLMSFGIHRAWKRYAIHLCALKPRDVVLDLASGSGDLAIKMAPKVCEHGKLYLSDINHKMLQQAQRRLDDLGLFNNIHFALANAEDLPFADNTFDCITMGFGLRNVTDKQQALEQCLRILKPAGRLLVLEFSTPNIAPVRPLYDFYSFKVLPKIGQWVTGDQDSYRYLAESIRQHPDQDTLKGMMQAAGFDQVEYFNLTGGVVAIHRGYKI